MEKTLEELTDQAEAFVRSKGFNGLADHTLVKNWMAEFAVAYEDKRRAELMQSVDNVINCIGNTQFVYKLYLESKDSANSFNLSKSIGELGRAKTKLKNEIAKK